MANSSAPSSPSPSAAPAAGPSAATDTANQLNTIEKASADALEATRGAAHSARMAMVAAIVSGVLAIGGTIVGGIIAGSSAGGTVAQQLGGESERSKQEFLRSQRQALYAKVLQHQAEVVISQRKLTDLTYLGEDFPDYKSAAKPMQQAITTLDRDLFQIQVLATTATVAKFATLIAAEKENEISIGNVARDCPGDSVTLECIGARPAKRGK